MTHLTPEQFIDLVDGVTTEAAVPHLAGCAACRTELTALRAAAGLALDDVVPEPSPLFWDHLSARVRAAVTAEPDRSVPAWVADWSWRKLAVSAAAAVAVVVVVASISGRLAPDTAQQATSPPPESPLLVVDDAALTDVDPQMQLVADLAAELDWEAAIEAGLAARAGAVERIVPELNAAERLELQRLIQEELARSGA